MYVGMTITQQIDSIQIELYSSIWNIDGDKDIPAEDEDDPADEISTGRQLGHKKRKEKKCSMPKSETIAVAGKRC